MSRPGRPRTSSTERGYNARWQRYRLRYLAEHPLCVKCQARGYVTAATVVDHIEPHKRDHKLFWDPKNHQALCKPCHDREKQREEKGLSIGCGPDGVPLSPRHHWNRSGGAGGERDG